MGENTPKYKETIVALVENKPGVLNRIASLLRRRNFNVDSLTVGRTHRPHVSRMTIVVDVQRVNVNIIAENLRKLVNVIEVKVVTHEPHVSRDLALVKVKTGTAENHNAITEICERSPARIVDMGPEVAIVEITGPETLVEEIIDKLRPIGIIEMIRTGVVAMGRGARIQDTEYMPPVPVTNGISSNGQGL